jgi:tRNA G10  N-methylase Trm11
VKEFKTVFIPGKNWRLSLAELADFMEARRTEFEILSFSKEFFVSKVREDEFFRDIASLGGFIKIGNIEAILPTEKVREVFLKKEGEAKTQLTKNIIASGIIEGMLESSSEKLVFGVSVYCADISLNSAAKNVQRFVGSVVKRELREHGKKTRYMGFPKHRKRPQLSHVEVLKKKFVENKTEILVCVDKRHTFIATTIAVHNPFEFQKRDVGKPVQRRIFAMPPRLARIMINLAACTEGKVLLDPFCGVGTILQEALLARAKVIGVDINSWCVEAAKRNLEWLKSEYSLEKAEERVLQGDIHELSRKIGREQIDCIATEPDLGPALRQVPTKPYALKIIRRLEPLYHSLLEEAYKGLKRKGRLVLVSPYIKTRSGNPVTMEIEAKATEIGFERVYVFKMKRFEEVNGAEKLRKMVSFVDVEERHKIGREIHVFQKQNEEEIG